MLIYKGGNEINNKWLNNLFSIRGFSIIIYKVLLDVSYFFIIAPLYSYYMDISREIVLIKLIESYALLFIVVLVTPTSEERLAHIFLTIQLLIMLIPMISIYGVANKSRLFMYTVTFCHCMQCALLLKKNKVKQKAFLKEGSIIFKILLITILSLTLVLMLNSFGIPNLTALNLNNVYEVRAENTLTFPLNYLVFWSASVILPFLLVLAISKRRWIVAILVVFSQLYIYLTFGNKAHLFSIIVVLFVYLIKKKNFLIKGMSLGMPILVGSTSLLYVVNKKFLFLPSLFVRRLLNLPAHLKFKYYEFFSENPKVYFADGTIGRLLSIESPYENSIPKIIAEYVGVPESSCNTGYWGDAYANMGIFGVVLLSLILVLVIHLTEKYTDDINMSIVSGAFVYSLYALNDSALLTRLLTGGLILLIILCGFLNSNEHIKKKSKLSLN